jgi:diacylglycerol kinase (ATP)
MSRHIIYIINPISGTRKKKDLQTLIEKETAKRNIPFAIFPSVASGDYSFLHAIIREKAVTDIVIAGGDGTVSQVVNNLMDFDLNFGIIPCGSGNGLAYAAKISKEPAKALQTIFEGAPVATDGFYINSLSPESTGRYFACMLCGLGFDAKVAHDFAQQPKRGLSTYIKQVLKNFLGAHTYSFDIKLNKESFHTEAYFISIANSNQFGNNFTIAPEASISDGLLDIVIVTSQNKLSVLLQTLRQITGMNKLQAATAVDKNKAVIYFQTDSIGIINKSNAPLHIDGEPAETAEQIFVKVNPGCFKLIQPL